MPIKIINKNKKYKTKNFYPRFLTLTLITLCVCVSIMVINSGGGSLVSASDYDGHWLGGVLNDWVQLGIINADIYGNIYPESNVTRGELATYINRVMGFYIAAEIHQYTDTPFGSEYFHDMSIAVGMGYIAPTSHNALSPYANITRAEAIDIFAKVARLNPAEGNTDILEKVGDADQIEERHRETVAAAIVDGFIAGRAGYIIAPGELMTVSEAVAMLDRLNSGRRVYGFPGVFGPELGMTSSNYASVMSPGVTLKNIAVSKELDINWAAAGAPVNLTGSVVRENLAVNGSGAHLIYTQDGDTEVETLIINGNNIKADINKGNKTRNIIINGINAEVNIGENVRIENLTVNSTAENARVNLASGARLNAVSLSARTDISGSGGSIGTLRANPGSGGSVIEPKPDSTITSPGEDITTGQPPPETPPPGGNGGGNGGGGNGGGGGSQTNPAARRITGLSFLSSLTLLVTTEDVGRLAVNSSDFIVTVDGVGVADFSVSKANNTEFNIIVRTEIPVSALVTVTGISNLAGEVSSTQNSQARITEAFVTSLRTINVAVTNPANTAFAKENFKLQIAGRDNDSFTVTARSLTSYDLNIAADIRSGQVINITGRNNLTGSVTVSSVSAVKSIVYNDTDRFTVNTDNTAGNIIDDDCFEIYVGGNRISDFTVSEKSKTAYQIVTESDITEGTVIRVTGRRFLTGTLEDVYSSPFRVSRVSVTNKTTISVTLASVPESILSTEKHAPAFKVLVDDKSADVTGVARDTSDRRGNLYNLTVDLDGHQGILTVNGVRNTNNKGAVDYVSPELVSVSMNDRALGPDAPSFRTEQSKSKLIVEFSEPVFRQAPSSRFANGNVALSGEAFNIISGTGSGLELNGTRVSVSSNSVIIDLANARRMDPGVYTLTVNTNLVFDALGNICVTPTNRTFRFEIKGAHPTVTSAVQRANGDVEVKLGGNATIANNFGNAMALGGTVLISDPTRPVADSIGVNNRFLSYDEKARAVIISRTALPPALNDPNNPVFLSGDIPYRIELYHADYSRGAWQSAPADEPPLIVSRATIDTQRPVIETVSINGMLLFDRHTGLSRDIPKVSKSNAVVQVVFSKPVFEQPPARRFSVVDTYAQAFCVDTANALSPANNLSLQGVRIASNNRTVSIPLRNAAVMNPGSYKIEIDPSLIFDAVGNTADPSHFVNLPGFPKLVCYFDVVNVPPSVTSVAQTVSGDINIRFTRYYQWLANPYGDDIYGMGVARILDMSKPEGERQIGRDITPEFFAPWSDPTKTLTVRRVGLPDNLTGGPYVIEIDVPDYEKQITPGFSITTGVNNDPSVTLGGSKNIPVNPNAEQTRITREEAVIRVNFPSSVNAGGGANFSMNNLGVTDNISASAFSVYAEDGDGLFFRLDKDLIRLTHSREQIIIDMTNALTSDMMFMKFTIAVNQLEIYDSRGVQIGNRLNIYRFKLTQTPLPINSAVQLGGGSGDIEINFGRYSDIGIDDDAIFSMARGYINSICGTNDEFMSSSTVRIERRGEVIGYIPAQFIKDTVIPEGITPNKIVIKRAALGRLIDLDGSPVNLDGGEYTLVLTHSAYADNRTERVEIDTTPPVLRDFGAFVSSDINVTLTFSFDEEVIIIPGSLSVTDRNGNQVSFNNPAGGTYNRDRQIIFAMTPGDSPPDYTIRFTAADIYGNSGREIISNPVIPGPPGNLTAENNDIPGFEAGLAGVTAFRLRESNFETYFDSQRRLRSGEAAEPLRTRIAGITPVYDDELSSPVVILQADMTVHAPVGAVSCRYVTSKSRDMQNMPGSGSFSDSLNIQNGRINVAAGDIVFYATQANGNNITGAQTAASTPAVRAAWTWTAKELTESSYYIIFEWTMNDGRKVYTYVQTIIGGS